MATVTKPVALDESLNTTDSTPKNIADVLKDKLGDIASAISGGGGGSGGHTIQNASGANMPQESTMQFKDSHVTDNSQADKTEVEVIKSVASADYSSETEDGLYLIPDGEGSVIEPASEDYVEVTADGNKTYAQLLYEIYTDAKFDATKLNKDSYIVIISSRNNYTNIFRFEQISNGKYRFVLPILVEGRSSSETISLVLGSTCSYVSYDTTYHDSSSSKPESGQTITLYYGNKKAVVDLQTTANRCLMPDGTTTVAQELSKEQSVSTTIPNTSTNKYVDMPTGFNKSNTAIMSIMVYDSNNNSVPLLNKADFNIYIGSSDKIVIWHTLSSYVGKNAVILLKRFA